MIWYNVATRETETSYMLITKQQPVEMPMLKVQNSYKTIRLLSKYQVTEINTIIRLLRLQYVDFR